MRVVDLFAGCGGMSLGFQEAGFEVVSAYEFWDSAISCYKLNFDHPVNKIDLSDVETATKLIAEDRPDIIIGGPPCQDFSSAGKRIESERANLTKCYAKIICEVKPMIFVMENVARAASSNAYKEARAILKEGGYGLTETVIDASYCGVPQSRKRFVCIGAINMKDGFLDEIVHSNLSEKQLTVREYFGDSLDFDYYYRHPRNYTRRGIFSIDEPAPTIRGVNRPVPSGYVGNPNDACPINAKIRSLTTLERSMIQTFPPTFKWIGTKTDKEQMIGNAVPVNLAKYIAQCIIQFINIKNKTETKLNTPLFETWLVQSKGYTERSAKDVSSRLRRADKMQHISSFDDTYLFKLEHTPSFDQVNSSIKSQIRRAFGLYCEYHDSTSNCRKLTRVREPTDEKNSPSDLTIRPVNW